MTEEITPRNGHPSSADLEIAKLKERHLALRADFGELRADIGDIKSLLLAHIDSAGTRHAQLLATFNQHNMEDAVVHQRVLQMESKLEEVTKRDPVTFWTSIAAAGTAVGAIATALFGGKP